MFSLPWAKRFDIAASAGRIYNSEHLSRVSKAIDFVYSLNSQNFLSDLSNESKLSAKLLFKISKIFQMHFVFGLKAY